MDTSADPGLPFLSIIIPAYNEEKRLPSALEQLDGFLKQQSYSSEVLIIENGSRDRTFELAKHYAEKFTYVRAIHEEQRGKGLAVKRGMLEACGRYRFICDADLSMPLEEIYRFLPVGKERIDVVIGSREASGAIRFDEPEYRHIIGRAFNMMVRLVALPGLQDTQCGFKCFRAEVAEEVFRLVTLSGMSFDVEALFIARRKGYHIKEIGIPHYFNPDSRVRLVHDSLHMAIDLFQIRHNAWRGFYDKQ